MPSPQSTSPPTTHHVALNNSFSFSPNEHDDIEEDPGFSDLQTVALACFLTLLPLMFGLVSYFGFRVVCKGRKSRKGRIRRPYVLYCWGRFRRSVEPSDMSKALDKDSSHRNRSSQGLLNEQLKSSESQFSVVPAEDIEEGGACYPSGNQTSKATANGSIITMTMKNNHLIVETETAIVDGSVEAEVENNDLLVVEVAPSADSTAIVHQAPSSGEEPRGPAGQHALTTGIATNHSHSPPSHTSFHAVTHPIIGFNTGLSTSDLSLSSESPNKSYVYGNQCEYDSTANFETQATQQLICHIVAPVDTYLEPVVHKVVTPDAAPELQLELTSGSEMKGETNPAYVPTPVTTDDPPADVDAATAKADAIAATNANITSTSDDQPAS